MRPLRASQHGAHCLSSAPITGLGLAIRKRTSVDVRQAAQSAVATMRRPKLSSTRRMPPSRSSRAAARPTSSTPTWGLSRPRPNSRPARRRAEAQLTAVRPDRASGAAASLRLQAASVDEHELVVTGAVAAVRQGAIVRLGVEPVAEHASRMDQLSARPGTGRVAARPNMQA